MSGNLTDKLPKSNDNLATVMKVVKDLTIKVEALNEKVELRLYDTKPMWEQVLKTVLEIKEGQQRLEQGQERLEQRQERLEQRQGSLEQRQGSLEQGQERLEQGQERLEQRQGSLEQRQEGLEQRQLSLEQTMEQLAQGQIQLQQNDQKTAQGLEALRRESYEIKTFCRDIMRRLSIFNDTLVTIQSDYRDIYDRVRLLEQSIKEPQQDLEPF
jgi:chromosome segregation ATPase